MPNDNNIEQNAENKPGGDADKIIAGEKADLKLGNILTRLKSLDRSQKTPGGVNFVTGDFIVPSSKEVKVKLIALAAIIAGNLFLFGIIYFVINFQGKKYEYELEQLANERDLVESQISNLKEQSDKIETMKKDITVANSLIDRHIFWDKFFEIIEKYTLADVYYNSMNIDASGNLRMDAIAKDYFNLNEQLSVFKRHPEYFSDVEFSSINLDKDSKTGKINGIKFFASMKVIPSIFYMEKN